MKMKCALLNIGHNMLCCILLHVNIIEMLNSRNISILAAIIVIDISCIALLVYNLP